MLLILTIITFDYGLDEAEGALIIHLLLSGLHSVHVVVGEHSAPLVRCLLESHRSVLLTDVNDTLRT